MPSFGHEMRALWALDPAITYLNHGTVGAPPRRVLDAQQAIHGEIEAQPARFLLRELTSIAVGMPRPGLPRMRAAAHQVAARLAADGDDLVFVDNATAGCNAVLRSLDLSPGDEVLATDLGYGGVTNTARYAARRAGAELRVVTMPYPLFDPQAAVDAIAAAFTPRTRVLVVDHITSGTALVLPLAAIAARARAQGVAVLADGAHAPGALPLDIPALGVDWYTGNLHKWAWSPRSSAILWAARERQAGLHPAVISWGLDQGFTAEFDLPGTRDPSPHLAAPAAFEYMEEVGIDAIRRHNHVLAWEGALLLAERWGTTLGMREAMVACMATVPLPAALGSTLEDAARLRDALLFEDRIEVALHAWRERLWVRISAQVYNQMSDIEQLAAAVLARVPLRSH